MNLVFVHGYSVTHTETYGQLPEVLEKEAPSDLNLTIQHIYLSRYISFHDEVTIDDIARALENARKEILGEATKFSCITHSTGAPVIRTWVDKYYGVDNIPDIPLMHLIMLAPANHGSALAQLGKARIGRIKSWFQDVEPGQGVLNWLELGSQEQRLLNLVWLKYATASNGFFPFVITGESIDKKLYDYINSYTAEKGSDGVVRVAAANMNYQHILLKQNTSAEKFSVDYHGDLLDVYPLEQDGRINSPAQPYAFEVLPNTSHSGKLKGILRSVTKRNSSKKLVVKSIIDCLLVGSEPEYFGLLTNMAARTEKVQRYNKYIMVVVRVSDDQGNEISDYDLFILAGNEYLPGKLPKGFFVDRQKNRVNSCHLTYYLNYSKLSNVLDGKIGVRVIARPTEGFVYYSPAEFRSNDIMVSDLFKPNETLYLDIELKRHVDVNTFRLDPLPNKRVSFKKDKPKGNDIA